MKELIGRRGARTFVLVAVLLPFSCQVEPRPSEAAEESAGTSVTGTTYDWLIHGGSVVDGTEAPPIDEDVLLKDGRIVHVGTLDPDTLDVRDTFDADGLVVAPGFIDAHAHGDPTERPAFDNFLAQGVTTIVLGQDGSSPEAATFARHLDAVREARPSVNVAYLVGHNTVRGESGVGFGDPGPDGLARMRTLVDTALAAGALGLSTGLEYSPGSQAGAEELAALAAPVAERGGVIMSHLRSEDADRVEASVRELVEQGRRSGASVHVSHVKVVLGNNPARADRILEIMARARESGLSVTADLYPYLASFTGIGILFPDWAKGENDYARVLQDRRAELAGHLRERVEARNGPEATLFGSGPWAGRTLNEVAEAEGRPFEEILLELGPGGARAAYFVMNEEVMTRFLTDPHVAIASDGSPTMAHPRGYGTFARVLGRYVAERDVLTLPEAIRKMTSLPASILGLDDPDRVDVRTGRLRAGWAADLVVFDAEEIRDRASFETPHTRATGVRAVWVSGQPAWSNGGMAGGPGHGRVITGR